MAKQLVALKDTVIAPAGMCLWYTQEKFNVPHVFATAHDAYLATKYKHNDRNFPNGVAVPVWFSWWGQLPGDTRKYEYDHAAVRMSDGKILSSPLSGRGSAWFASVDDLVLAFGGGMKYVGWSEDISNVKVIELEENMAKITTEAVVALSIATTGKQPSNADEIKYIGKEATQENLDGLITYWSSRSRISELESKLKDSIPTSSVTTKESVIDYLTKNLK